jgi:tRNA-splicing ligase RtcB
VDSNHETIEVGGGVPIKAWIRGVPIEDQARKQLENVARLPFVHRHVAVMPDVHYGIGATVGSAARSGRWRRAERRSAA